MKGRRTSSPAAKAASKVLRSGATGKASKTAAGSALSQRSKGSTKKSRWHGGPGMSVVLGLSKTRADLMVFTQIVPFSTVLP